LIVNLGSEESRISEVMAGPWQDVRLDRVTAGESLELTSKEAEHAGFVVVGTGELQSASGERFTVEPGVAFAVPAGGSVTVLASADLEILHIIMNVDQH